MAKPRSEKQAQAQVAAALRAEGATWAQVAADFMRRYQVNARVALRLAHGWSQRQAAEAWSVRWPDEPKTFKNFSAWEQWPGATGHAPSLDTLERLAQLYGCHVGDLLRDRPDHGAGRPMTGHNQAAGRTLVPTDAEQLLLDLFGQATPHEPAASFGMPVPTAAALLHRL